VTLILNLKPLWRIHVSFAKAILNLGDIADQPSARQSSTGRTESDAASNPDLTTDEIVGEEAMSIEEDSCAEDLTPAESPCIVEAVPETEPTHPVDDVAEEAPGDWNIWDSFISSGKKKKDKKKEKGRHIFRYFEEARAEEAPYEEAPTEEVPAEEAPYEEAPYEEAPAEEAPYEAPAEEASAADYYASPRAYKYKAFSQETKLDNTPCRRRGYHLANDARWVECPKCRAELSTIARIMTASTPGWRNFS
jgi:hypothetical protein